MHAAPGHTGRSSSPPTPITDRSSAGLLAALSLGLVVLVAAVFGRTVTYGFVNFDDGLYVTANAHVREGLDPESIRWALTSLEASNWHPLTWLSHMLDVELSGLDAGRHHLTNVVLHALAGVLLLLGLHRMTGAVWPSALVAFLFAVHPLRAESVAWIAERKDVLSGVFWMLTLLLWARYAERPSLRGYLAVTGSFVLGLAAKPMLVTLPMVLLLLDVWPLRRARAATDGEEPRAVDPRMLARLAVEKLPLLALAGASCLLTVMAQRGVVGSFEAFPVTVRAANAVVGWAGYVKSTLFPVCLAAFYPHPGRDLPLSTVVVAGIFLVVVTAVVVHQLNPRPWLAVGWFWYLGTLVPVIGLVQVGTQATADRYTYIPQIGLWIMVAWTAVEAVRLHPRWRIAVGAGSVAVIVAFSVVTARQVATWRDGFSLFGRALECTRKNWLAHANIAELLNQAGRYDEALEHCRRSLEINPSNPVPHVNAGNALLELGRPEEALEQYQSALAIDPDRTIALYDLGNAHAKMSQHEEAAAAFRRALDTDPAMTAARVGLGVQLLYLDRPDDAIEVLCIDDPGGDASLTFNCGLALAADHRLEEAVSRFRSAIAGRPDYGAAWIALGHSLADLGRNDEAIQALRRAASLRPNDAGVRRRLAELTSEASGS